MKRAISPPALLPAEKIRKYVNTLPFAQPSPITEERNEAAAAKQGVEKAERDSRDKETRLKIMTWNCDGLSQYLSTLPTGMDTFLRKKKAPETANRVSVLTWLLEKHLPDVMCLQEVHLWRDELKQVKRQLEIDAPAYTFHSCLPVGRTGRRKAGVLTLYRKDLAPVTSSTVSWDDEGRISILEIGSLLIYNCYSLNSSENPFKDPVSGQVRGTRSERKREFDSSLAREMSSRVDRGHNVVLLGDLNISRYPIDALGGHLRTHHPHDLNRAHFNEVFAPFRDVIRERYPREPKWTWFSRAGDAWTGNNDKARVDHIMASAGVVVLEADTLESIDDRARSDHGPLYVVVRHDNGPDAKSEAPP